MSWKVQQVDDNTLGLLSVEGLGVTTLSILVRGAGGLQGIGEAVYSGDAIAWLPQGACSLLREKMLRIEVDPVRWSAEAIDATLVVVTDDEFPLLLSPLPACPAILWYLGNLDALQRSSVGIVGSRRCSEYGKRQACEFAKAIVASDIAVVSGGARGIDAAAHRGALANDGLTAAVLGSGLGVVYPPEHVTLFQTIVDSGGVVLSEFSCQRSPRPAHFPRRNRIVSGLSSVILVVEAAKRSGALITARIAVEEHGRQAFAIPGRVGDYASAGCLRAIRDSWMGIAIDPDDMVEEAMESWRRLSQVSNVNSCEGLQ